MVWGNRYIQLDDDGRVEASCSAAVAGVTIDTEGMQMPEEPTDTIYSLYYNEGEGLYWKKVGEKDTGLTGEERQDAALTYILAMTEGGA